MNEWTAVNRALCDCVILSEIFSQLSLCELTVCRRVCKLWLQLAESELNRRLNTEYWFFAYKKRKPFTPQGTKQNSNYLDEFTSNLEQSLNHTRLRIRPQNALVFYGDNSDKKDRFEDLNKFFTSFPNLIPPNCRSIFIHSKCGVVGFDQQIEPNEVLSVYTNETAVSYLFTPKYLNQQNCGIVLFDEKESLNLFDVSNPIYNNLKCVIVFRPFRSEISTAKSFEHIERMIVELRGKVAFGGAVVDVMGFYEGTHSNALFRFKFKELIGVAFYGDKVKSASIVLRTRTETDLRNTLLNFRQNLDFDPDFHNSKVETIGFMFIDKDRNVFTYGRLNVESQIFHEVFPKVKLNGVLCYSEGGVDYLPKQPLKTEVDGEYWHYHATVI
ncbi:F-box only protein 22-like protein, partial [Dinothrombium tinctorium]